MELSEHIYNTNQEVNMNQTTTTPDDTDASPYNHQRDEGDTRFQPPKRDDFDEAERQHTEVPNTKDTEGNNEAGDDNPVTRYDNTPNLDEPVRDENTMNRYDATESHRFNETAADGSDIHSKEPNGYNNDGNSPAAKTDQVREDTMNRYDYEAEKDEPAHDNLNTRNDTERYDTPDHSEKSDQIDTHHDEHDTVWKNETEREEAKENNRLDENTYTERFEHRDTIKDTKRDHFINDNDNEELTVRYDKMTERFDPHDEREAIKDTREHDSFLNDKNNEALTVRYDEVTERFDHRDEPETLKNTRELDHFINDKDNEALTVRYDEATERFDHRDDRDTLKDTRERDSFLNDKNGDERKAPRQVIELKNLFEAGSKTDNLSNTNERQQQFDEKASDEAKARDENDSDNLADSDKSPGVILRQERERQKMSVKYVADKIRLDLRVIEFIEADNYEDLPPTIFVRGYLRNYAKLLEIDPLPIIRAYERLQEEPLLIYPEPQSKPKKQARSHDIWPITASVVIALMVLAVLWQFYPKNPDPTTLAGPSESIDEPDESPWTPTFPLTETEEPVTPTEMDDNNPNIPTENPSVEPKTPMTAVNSTENTDVPIEESEPTVNLSHNMRVRFKDRAWIRITDSSGKRLYEGTGNAGEILPLEGTPPFSLLVGNFDGVDIEYNGEINKIIDYPKQKGQKNLYIVGGEE
jgi:cytoskeleton protein RodZ